MSRQSNRDLSLINTYTREPRLERAEKCEDNNFVSPRTVLSDWADGIGGKFTIICLWDG